MGILSNLRKGVGNTLVRIIYGNCFEPTTTDDYSHIPSSPDHPAPPHVVSQPTNPVSAPHVVSQPANPVSELALDLFHFDNTCEVPEQLSEYVASSKKAQAKWYKKILKAWKGSKPQPKTPEQASRLVMQTLHQNQKAGVEGLLKFYGLPVLDEHHLEIPAVANLPPSLPEGVEFKLHTFPVLDEHHLEIPAVANLPPSLPEGVEFKLHTFPVDAKSVPDGDGLTVYVDVSDPREATLSVPQDVQVAVLERSKACASKDYPKANALQKAIVDAGYSIQKGSNNKDVLARKYRIRLRGIDAPEYKQPFGKKAKRELTKLVKGNCVTVHVYGEDQYCRLVGDVYCNGKFVQEILLKKGLAWHYAAHDKRPELKKWAKEARAAGVGLWASSDPEKPWKWRKNNSRDGKLDKPN